MSDSSTVGETAAHRHIRDIAEQFFINHPPQCCSSLLAINQMIAQP